MIRSVVLAKLSPGYDTAELQQFQEGLLNLNLPGTQRVTVGTDAGLREGNWDFAIVADFDDVAAYRCYDEDAEHNRLRARLAALVEQICRVQLELPDS